MKEFARLFSLKRAEKGLSQDEIAARLNVTRQAVSKWENGKAMPDISLMPLIAEILDVSIEELMTGKEPEKQVVEKVVVQEKIIEKPLPLRKILAIVVPIVLVVVLASALMGVYIPKAIANNKPPITETPKPEPKIEYTEVYLKGKCGSDDSTFQAPLIADKAYYALFFQFSSDYTLYITAPNGAVATLIERDYRDETNIASKEIAQFEVAKTVEYKQFFDAGKFFMNDRFEIHPYDFSENWMSWGDGRSVTYKYNLIIDMTKCSDEDRNSAKQKVLVSSKIGFDNVTVPANSSYFVALPVKKEMSVEHYEIRSAGVQFVNTRKLAVNTATSDRADRQFNRTFKPISDFYVLNYEGCAVEGQDYDWYIGLINETDKDIRLEIEQVPIEEIALNQSLEVKANGIRFYKRVYKLDLGENRPTLMYKMKGEDAFPAQNISYISGEQRYCSWYFKYGYEPEWNSVVYSSFYKTESSICYIIAETDEINDYIFALDSWDRYDSRRP